MEPLHWKSFAIGFGIIFVAVHAAPLLGLKEWAATATDLEFWVVTVLLISAIVYVPLAVVAIYKHRMYKRHGGR